MLRNKRQEPKFYFSHWKPCQW